VHIAKNRLGDMSKQLTEIAFPNIKKKQEDHYKVATNLGGMLALIVKEDPRQKENLENHMAFGAFAQNLMLLLYEAGIGTCWKTQHIYSILKYAAFSVYKMMSNW